MGHDRPPLGLAVIRKIDVSRPSAPCWPSRRSGTDVLDGPGRWNATGFGHLFGCRLDFADAAANIAAALTASPALFAVIVDRNTRDGPFATAVTSRASNCSLAVAFRT